MPQDWRTVISADWGKSAGKRAVYVASRARRWTICRVPPPVDGWSVPGLVELARTRHRADGGTVLIGIDAVLGIPRRYAGLLDVNSFLECLPLLSASGGLDTIVHRPEDWRPETPFFRVPRGKGGRKAFEAVAGGSGVLMRDIECRTRANPVFITSGIPGSVGSGSLSLWKKVLNSLDDPRRDFGLWPFEGSFEELSDRYGIVLGESYPRASYAVALAESLPAGMRTVAKTKARERIASIKELDAAAWVGATSTRLQDLDSAETSEDDFDALMATAATVRLVVEHRPLAAPMAHPGIEGGILLTGGIDFDPGRSSHPGPARSGEPVPAGRPRRLLCCPIPGCDKVFVNGRSGWDAHIASVAQHPAWHPDIEDPETRRSVFRQEYKAWFPGG